jgi:hypothetical protein
VCLHHTGDLPRAVAEVRRVPRSDGRTTVVLSTATRFCQLQLRWPALLAPSAGAAYDANAAGDAAPEIVCVITC